MKVLLVNGGPHEKGCTYTALCEIEKELKANGIDSEIFWLGNKSVRGCIGCGGCKGSGRCVFGNEDMVNEALEKMEAADGLIVGSPVYFASPNGSLISFLDRFFYAGKAFTFSYYDKRRKALYIGRANGRC